MTRNKKNDRRQSPRGHFFSIKPICLHIKPVIFPFQTGMRKFMISVSTVIL